MSIQWLTTNPNPRRRMGMFSESWFGGWKLHAIEAPDSASQEEVKFMPALCGVRARYGWGFDLFLEDKCRRCKQKAEAA